MSDKSKNVSSEKIKETKFRVSCMHPYLEGAIQLQSQVQHVCAHGTGMTVDEINENLIWPGRPYIRINYCKSCYTDNTVGVLDDNPRILGWIIIEPDKENPKFRLREI